MTYQGKLSLFLFYFFFLIDTRDCSEKKKEKKEPDAPKDDLEVFLLNYFISFFFVYYPEDFLRLFSLPPQFC